MRFTADSFKDDERTESMVPHDSAIGTIQVQTDGEEKASGELGSQALSPSAMQEEDNNPTDVAQPLGSGAALPAMPAGLAAATETAVEAAASAGTAPASRRSSGSLHRKSGGSEPPEVPTATVDFGMLKEGHTWRAFAGSVPAGSRIDSTALGTIVSKVLVDTASHPVGVSSDGGENVASGDDAEHHSDLAVIIKPQGQGSFEESAHVRVVGPDGTKQSMNIRVLGTVMGLDTGTPMVRPNVQCVDPS